MLQVMPYVGQMVNFMPNPTDEVAASNGNSGYIAAIITRVWSEKVVNIKIIPDHGPMQDRGSVSHISINSAGYHFIYIEKKAADVELTTEELVSFGNYLLSEARDKSVSELGRNSVSHADIENWKVINGLI